jgi:hypothetical protein
MEQSDVVTIIKAIEMLEGLNYSDFEKVIDDISIVTQSLIDLTANAQLKNLKNDEI